MGQTFAGLGKAAILVDHRQLVDHEVVKAEYVSVHRPNSTSQAGHRVSPIKHNKNNAASGRKPQ